VTATGDGWRRRRQASFFLSSPSRITPVSTAVAVDGHGGEKKIPKRNERMMRRKREEKTHTKKGMK
jgi:hypothetical protein